MSPRCQNSFLKHGFLHAYRILYWWVYCCHLKVVRMYTYVNLNIVYRYTLYVYPDCVWKYLNNEYTSTLLWLQTYNCCTDKIYSVKCILYCTPLCSPHWNFPILICSAVQGCWKNVENSQTRCCVNEIMEEYSTTVH